MEEFLINVIPKKNFYKIRLKYKIVNLSEKEFLYPEQNQEFYALKKTKFKKDRTVYFTKQGSIFNSYEVARARAVFLLNRGFVSDIIEKIEYLKQIKKETL